MAVQRAAGPIDESNSSSTIIRSGFIYLDWHMTPRQASCKREDADPALDDGDGDGTEDSGVLNISLSPTILGVDY